MPPEKYIPKPPSPRGPGGKPPRLTKELRRWWATLSCERNGRARYTKKQLEKIRDSDERRNPFMKRVAAAHFLMLMQGGRTSLDVMQMMFDRIEGKVPLRVDLSLDEQPKRIVLIDTREIAATQVAGELEVHDVPKVISAADGVDDSSAGTALGADANGSGTADAPAAS